MRRCLGPSEAADVTHAPSGTSPATLPALPRSPLRFDVKSSRSCASVASQGTCSTLNGPPQPRVRGVMGEGGGTGRRPRSGQQALPLFLTDPAGCQGGQRARMCVCVCTRVCPRRPCSQCWGALPSAILAVPGFLLRKQLNRIYHMPLPPSPVSPSHRSGM